MKRRTRLPVQGMHCAACSSRIEKVVGQMDGVVRVSVNLAAETMDIAWDPDRLRLEDVANRLREMGFTLALPEEEGTPATVVFRLGNMHCAACSSRIEKVVGQMDGVVRAEVNLAAETGRFTFDPKKVGRRAIREAIEGLGFTATALADASPVLAPFAYSAGGSFPGYVERDPGTYRVRFTENGSLSVLADTGPIGLGQGEIVTVLLVELPGGGLGFVPATESR